MNKTTFFLILLIISTILFSIILITGFLLTPTATNPTDWTNNMWSCMNDWVRGGTLQGVDSSWIFFGTALIISIALITAGAIGTIYYFLFPEIKIIKTNSKPESKIIKTSNASYQSVVKTLTSDERKVIEVLKNHNGKYLQKYIRKESGLSRLKTHRIIARFVNRNLVIIEKVGNTNEVKLKDWLIN